MAEFRQDTRRPAFEPSCTASGVTPVRYHRRRLCPFPVNAAEPPDGMSWLVADDNDPRHRVTETGFRVDPGLLGRSLAHPLRRLAALLLDLAAVGGIVLSKVISPWLFALVAAWLLWRVADPRADLRLPTERLRTVFRWTSVATAGVAILALMSGLLPDGETDSPAGNPASAIFSSSAVGRGSVATPSPLADSPARFEHVVPVSVRSLRAASSAEAARERAAGLALEIYRSDAAREQVRDSLREVVEAAQEDGTLAWDVGRSAIVQHALTTLDSTAARRTSVRDSLLRVLAATADSGRAGQVSALASRLLGTPPPATRHQLKGRVDHLQSELEAARQPPSLLDLLWGALNDLGVGLGWLGIYFTASLALGRGRTPGKWLLGIRVVRIDGEPLTTWDAFSRFGGYAAGVVTGLLGFAQVLWHPNRQAIHDRIAGTVVIEDR